MTTNKTNRGSQAIGATVGAIAFGAAGAIIGGLSGSSTSRKQVGKAAITLITRLHDCPYLHVKVFNSTPVDRNGFVYTQLTKDMMPWYGRLKAIIETS